MEERKSKRMVETGTIREKNSWHNEGGFTWHLGHYAQRSDAKLTTIDCDKKAIKVSREVTAEFAGHIEYVTADSVAYLKTLKTPIDVLMLDSVDYHEGHYQEAQAHNLNEVMAALPALHEKSIIAIDDCALEGGGKGGISIPYLTGTGWKIAHEGYMTILVGAA